MGGLLLVYAHNMVGHFLCTKIVYKGKGWMGGQKGKNFVYVIIEWPLSRLLRQGLDKYYCTAVQKCRLVT